jgi:hypothetical protein
MWQRYDRGRLKQQLPLNAEKPAPDWRYGAGFEKSSSA